MGSAHDVPKAVNGGEVESGENRVGREEVVQFVELDGSLHQLG